MPAERRRPRQESETGTAAHPRHRAAATANADLVTLRSRGARARATAALADLLARNVHAGCARTHVGAFPDEAADGRSGTHATEEPAVAPAASVRAAARLSTARRVGRAVRRRIECVGGRAVARRRFVRGCVGCGAVGGSAGVTTRTGHVGGASARDACRDNTDAKRSSRQGKKAHEVLRQRRSEDNECASNDEKDNAVRERYS